MGCAPVPRKNDNIPKLNAEPEKKEGGTVSKIAVSEARLTKARFEDVKNMDFVIKEERRVNIEIRRMDFLYKTEVEN